MVQVKLFASSVTRPRLFVNLALLYDTGLDPDYELLQYGIDNDDLQEITVSENGAWKYLIAPMEQFEKLCPGLAVKDHAERKGFGFKAFQSGGFRDLLGEYPGLREIMREAVTKHWRAGR